MRGLLNDAARENVGTPSEKTCSVVSLANVAPDFPKLTMVTAMGTNSRALRSRQISIQASSSLWPRVGLAPLFLGFFSAVPNPSESSMTRKNHVESEPSPRALAVIIQDGFINVAANYSLQNFAG
jgi:hypothetical protein